MNGVSVIDAVEFLPRRAASRPDPALDPWVPAPVLEPVAADRAPHPSGIPWHVIDAHEAAKARPQPPASVTCQLHYLPDVRAFELIPATDGALHALRALGDGAFITINL